MPRTIDLNADLGEGSGPWAMGDDDTMLSLVSSANVACGGHAGDNETMYRTLATAARNGVVVGAHPGYNDREGFGRRVIPMTSAEVGRLVAAQIGALQAIATLVPVQVRYVKPHGALANLAARDPEVARAVVDAVNRVDDRLAILAISGTQLDRVSRIAGVTTFSEVFADRGYQASGQLVPRDEPGAMIREPQAATDRLLAFLETGLMPVVDGGPIALEAHSICVHGDSDSAVAMTRMLREQMVSIGMTPTAFLAPEHLQ